MRRHDPALVFEGEEPRPQHRGLDLRAVVESGVPVAERSVEAAAPQRQRIAERIAELDPFQVDHQRAVLVLFEHEFDDRLDSLADGRRHIQVDVAKTEAAAPSGVVGRITGVADIDKSADRNPVVGRPARQQRGWGREHRSRRGGGQRGRCGCRGGARAFDLGQALRELFEPAFELGDALRIAGLCDRAATGCQAAGQRDGTQRPGGRSRFHVCLSWPQKRIGPG